LKMARRGVSRKKHGVNLEKEKKKKQRKGERK